MKILYITNARLPTEKAHGLQIMKTCEALAKAGNDLVLAAPERRNILESDPFTYWSVTANFSIEKYFTIDLIRYGRIGFLIQSFSFALSAAIGLRRGWDLIYGRDEVVLAVLAFFGFRPIVWESHDGAWNRAARYIARRAFRIVVVSGGLRQWYIEKGVDAERIVVVPNAIDLEQFANPETKETARQRLGLPRNKKIAMYIGRLDGWKGTDTLLEASKLFGDEVQLVMIGGQPEQVHALRQRYPRVSFLGARPYEELPSNQAAADVLVVPNTGKSDIGARFTSPLKLIAHMASNRPIVASDLPSIRELVGNDAALLVPPDDARALQKGIQNVLQNEALSERLCTRAQEKVSAYSWDARAEAILRIGKRV